MLKKYSHATTVRGELIGPVKITDTVGPSVIGGNTITGVLSCRSNEPAPVNNGEQNQVRGIKTGQCHTL